MAHSLLEAAAFFTGTSLAMEKASKAAITRSAKLIRDEAKRVLGTYDYGWPRLADSTIEQKATGDSPLLETGELRRSIKYSVTGERLTWVAYIGSNNPKALWQELGTVNIPPRSFLAGAAMHKEQEVREICGHDMLHSVFHSHHPDFEDEWSYDGED